jgi:hypothetical protein
MNLSAIRRQIARIQTRLAARAEDMRFHIPAHSGMAGLRTALQAVREARQIAPPCLPLVDMPNAPLSPLARLRADILQEQERRAKWMAALPPGALGNEPAIETIEEQEQCALPITPQPET